MLNLTLFYLICDKAIVADLFVGPLHICVTRFTIGQISNLLLKICVFGFGVELAIQINTFVLLKYLSTIPN